LYVNGLVGRTDKVKVLGNGELKGKLSFKVSAVSEKAKSAIEAAGGSVELLAK
jgi:large subunit ribosomal protein L15